MGGCWRRQCAGQRGEVGEEREVMLKKKATLDEVVRIWMVVAND